MGTGRKHLVGVALGAAGTQLDRFVGPGLQVGNQLWGSWRGQGASVLGLSPFSGGRLSPLSTPASSFPPSPPPRHSSPNSLGPTLSTGWLIHDSSPCPVFPGVPEA